MALQSDREFPSLLFTPRAQDKQLESSYRTKSPRSTRSNSTPAYGRNSVGHREGSSRRSLTPPGGARDTPPPPPPFSSILDANKGSAVARTQDLNGGDVLGLQDNEKDPDDEASQDAWVTVFGFSAQDQQIVLREFAKCGNILQFGNGREDRVNWTHIQYSNQYQAQRALSKGGQVVAGRIMVGVTRLEPQFRTAAEALSSEPARLSSMTSRQAIIRPHKLDTSSGQTLPSSRNSTWAKISEFVLGA